MSISFCKNFQETFWVSNLLGCSSCNNLFISFKNDTTVRKKTYMLIKFHKLHHNNIDNFIMEGELLMNNVDRIIANIKTVDCPPDKLQERVADACKVPGIGGNPAVIMDRAEDLDREDLKAYSIHIVNADTPGIVAMVHEGIDGYVSTVVDAYTEQ
jgi:hypothetical protein